MRRVPSCLLLASFALFLGVITSVPVSASPGIRDGAARPGHRFARTVHGGPRALRVRAGRIGYRAAGFSHRVGSFGHRHYGRRLAGHGLFPGGLWGWPYLDDRPEPGVAPNDDSEPATSYPAFTGIPSVADLPADTGIGPSPVAPPTVYVLNGSPRGIRRSSGAKVVTAGDVEGSDGAGPRIIHLNVPRSHSKSR